MDRSNKIFHSWAINLSKQPDFYQRMDHDVTERNIRDYSIKKMKKKPYEYPPYDRRHSKKKAEIISSRLHSGNRSTMNKNLKHTKSLRTLNLSNNSRDGSEISRASTSRKRVFSKHRTSLWVTHKAKEK